MACCMTCGAAIYGCAFWEGCLKAFSVSVGAVAYPKDIKMFGFFIIFLGRLTTALLQFIVAVFVISVYYRLRPLSVYCFTQNIYPFVRVTQRNVRNATDARPLLSLSFGRYVRCVCCIPFLAFFAFIAFVAFVAYLFTCALPALSWMDGSHA